MYVYCTIRIEITELSYGTIQKKKSYYTYKYVHSYEQRYYQRGYQSYPHTDVH